MQNPEEIIIPFTQISLLDIRPEGIVISLLDVAMEDWSLGHGEAQYA